MTTGRLFFILLLFCPPLLKAQQDILLITMDTTRADHLSCYGYGKPTSPSLDAFAKGATVFTRAYTPVPYTLPAHATILTGLWPKDHGVRDNIITPLKSSIPTVASLLKTRGYLTAAFVSSFVLDRRFALDRGFARYDDRMTLHIKDDEERNERPAQETEKEVVDYLAGLPEGGRVFLWVHLYDPHAPYVKHPDTPVGMGDYDGEIRHMDRSVGKILLAWDARRRGMVVITADHGEALGDHGESYHGIFLYEACVHVPLMIRAGDGLSAGRDDRLASLADIAPTVLEFAGVSRPALPGRSLLSEGPLHDLLFFESFIPANNFGWSPPFAVLKDGWKYIHLPRPELYHVGRDPAEKDNRADADRSRARELLKILEKGYGLRYTPPQGVPDRETIRRLNALGYRGGSTAHPGRDPKGLVWVVDEMDRGRALEREKDFAGAEAAYRKILQANPENSPVRIGLCAMLKRLGRRGEARAILAEALDINPVDMYTHYDLGVLDYEENRFESARGHFNTVLALFPEHQDSLFSLFWMAFKEGKIGAARDFLERAAKINPDHPDVPFMRGLTAARNGDLKNAVEYFHSCLRLKPDHVDALNGLGQACYQMGRFEESVQAYKHVLQVNPDQPQAYLHLGAILLNSLKNPAGALEYFQAFLDRYPTDAEAPRVLEIVRELKKSENTP